MDVATGLQSDSSRILANVMEHVYQTGYQTTCDEPSDEMQNAEETSHPSAPSSMQDDGLELCVMNTLHHTKLYFSIFT
jgi:hypothetical protein